MEWVGKICFTALQKVSCKLTPHRLPIFTHTIVSIVSYLSEQMPLMILRAIVFAIEQVEMKRFKWKRSRIYWLNTFALCSAIPSMLKAESGSKKHKVLLLLSMLKWKEISGKDMLFLIGSNWCSLGNSINARSRKWKLNT